VTQDLHLFDAYGVELEYMIVDRGTLAVAPIADEAMRAATGEITSDVERGPISWSNELVLHVIELKTTDPAPTLAGLRESFQENVREINGFLEPMNARLLPGAIHPTMMPDKDARLWPHDYSPVYKAFDRVFDCRGHGWSNLQSLHINLPFHGDEEFGRLHAAIRLVLPILPALAASSPIVEGAVTDFDDYRLETYRNNAARVPSVSGKVIPEAVFTREAYETQIFQRMYRDISPFDPDGILQHEWLNARGAIARFDRDAIEIRVIDVQEFPGADVAIVALVTELVRGLVEERWSTFAAQQSFEIDPLAAIFLDCVRSSDQAPIHDESYLRALGWAAGACSANTLWRKLYEAVIPAMPPELHAVVRPVEHILEHGTLARRIRRAVASESIAHTYAHLAECLHDGRPFPCST
jgi:gamma-glutamyl:cysteine ligase YbdK (ATP-grasp superfamily)